MRDGHTAFALVARRRGAVRRAGNAQRRADGRADRDARERPRSRDDLTLDASGTLDPDGPTDVRSYAFDTDGDGGVDHTSPEPTLTRTVTGPVTRTATVRATDALGRESEPASVTYTARDGTLPPPPPPPPD